MKKYKTHKKVEKPVIISKKHKLILGILIAIIGFLLYSNTLKHEYVLDDYSVIKENWVVKQGTEGIPTILKTSYRYGYWNKQGSVYRPLSLIMFAVEWQLSEDNPFLGHFINVLFYALTGLLLFFTLSKIFKKYNIILPFIISLLFIAHPIHTEVVANIKSRDEIMSFFFILLSINLMWTYLKNNKISYLVVSLFLYFLAFISKEGVITILAVIPLLIYFFTDVSLKKNLKISLFFLIPAIAYLLLRKKIIGQVGAEDVSVIDNLLVAAKDTQSKAATSLVILGKYLLKLIYPNTLVADYSYNQIPIVSFSSLKAIISLLIYIGAGAFAVIKFKKKNIIAFGILFYLISMSIYSNLFITIGSSFAERFLYFSSLGFIIVISFIIVKLFKKDISYKGFGKLSEFFRSNSIILLIVVFITIFYSFKTINRNKDWQSNFSLYEADVANSPNSAHMRYYYGLSLMKDKSLEAKNEQERIKFLDMSINEFKAAAKIYPQYADAYDQLGLAHFRKGLKKEALEFYDQAIKLNPNKPIAFNNMGIIYFETGNYEKALEVYHKAVELNPRYADAYYNLGSVYGTLQQFEKAIENFKLCIKYNPSKSQAHYFLGITYQSIGDEKNAEIALNKAYQLNPLLRK